MSVHELRHQSTIKEPVHELGSADSVMMVEFR